MKMKKYIALSLSVAMIVWLTPSAFAATTTISKVATQVNVVAGSDNGQSATQATDIANINVWADNSQTWTISVVQPNITVGSDNTQASTFSTTTPNGTWTVQVDTLTLTWVYDATDEVSFTAPVLWTITGSLASANLIANLNQLVIDVQWAGTYASSPFTVSWDGANNAMIITAKSASGSSYVLSTNVLDGWVPSSPGSSITPTVTPVDTVAQVSKVTLSGVVEEWDIFSIDLDWLGSDIVSYSAWSGETLADVTAALYSQLTSHPNYGAKAYTAAYVATNDFITFTAKTPGTWFNVTTNATNRVAVAQVSRVTISWTVETGDSYFISFQNNVGITFTGSYTAVGWNTTTDVATGLKASIDTVMGTGAFDFTTAPSTNKVDFTASVAGTPFTVVSAWATNYGGLAQVDSVTFTGTVEAGDVYSVTMPSTTVISYTAISGNTLTSVATWMLAAIIADGWYAAESVTASLSGTAVVFTAETPGTGFTILSNATNRAAVAQIDTFTVWTVTVGDTVVIDINWTIYSYLIQTGNTVNDVVTALKTMINGDAASPVVASGTSTLILTAKVAWTSFTASGSIVTTGTVDRTVTLKSGWNVFSTPQVLSSLSFSNGTAAWLSFYKLEGWVWAGTTVTPNTTNIKPLEGFIVYNSNSSSVQAYLTYSTGLTPAQKIFQKSLSAGWNVVWITTTSAPLTTIGTPATASVDFTNGGAKLNEVDSTFATTNWNVNVATPELWEAYWVFMSTSWIYGGSQ